MTRAMDHDAALAAHQLKPPPEMRYIKLGAGGRWFDQALDAGELQFGYGHIPHELCLASDWPVIMALLLGSGHGQGAATTIIGAIRSFYTLGPDCLWITFARNRLWWTYADPLVTWVGGDGSSHGQRSRRSIGGWQSTDRLGNPLLVDHLSTRLTQVAAYRATLCRVNCEDYVLRRLDGIEEPAVQEAHNAAAQMIASAARLIGNLHWADFETMVDLIFARSGWQRVSRVGGTQRDIDLRLRQAVTGETAFVQVKSKATQHTLDDYLARFDESGDDRLFFICHSPTGTLSAVDRREVQIWDRGRISAMAVEAGLFSWLIDKVS